MNYNDFEKALQSQNIPPAGSDAKAKAKQAALMAFREEQQAGGEAISATFGKNTDQEKSSFTHLTPKTDNVGDKPMMTYKRWMMASGLAASVVFVIGVLIVLPITQTHDQAFIDGYEYTPSVTLQSRGAVENKSAQADVVLTTPVPTQSQIAPMRAESPKPREREAIVVTGSRITRSDYSANSPVTTVDGSRFEQARAVNMNAHLNQLPSFTPAAGDGNQTQETRQERDRFSVDEENTVKKVTEYPVSTFAVDVDTASYSFVRKRLNNGVLPASDAVRTEEMINYFDYAYPLPKDRSQPFKATLVVHDSPWKKGNKLIHIGIKGYDLANGEQPDSNLVFLLDVSGSMNSQDKLPLVKQSMALLLETLKPTDTVAIVVYAGAAGTVLEPTKVSEKEKILSALSRLQAGGSTAGAEGIALAYQLAQRNYRDKAVNRVVLATDGDFNVGVTQDERLEDFVVRQRDKGIFLSVLGFGQGNYQDALMQTLAQNGNGVAAYIDTLNEAHKVLVNEASSTLFPIAKDVKIQVEFNPKTVSEYRLIGYETRALNREDFNNDKVDAGDIGAGHTVTAIYEITPAGSDAALMSDLRYQQQDSTNDKPSNVASQSTEYGFLKIRYKLPDESESKLISEPIKVAQTELNAHIKREVEFATAVAGYSQLLKSSRYSGDFSYDDVIDLAQANKGQDPYGYRTEFIQLVRIAKTLKQ